MSAVEGGTSVCAVTGPASGAVPVAIAAGEDDLVLDV